jgi:hypothetical protein
MQRTGLLSMPVRRIGRVDGNPHKYVRSSARFWPVGGHGISVPIGHPSVAIAIPSLSIFDAPESIRRFHISAGLIKGRSGALKSRFIGFVVSKSRAMVGGRIARFLISNIVTALRSKAMWLIAKNRRRAYPGQLSLHFRLHCKRNLVQDVHRLVHLTDITGSACQERSP